MSGAGSMRTVARLGGLVILVIALLLLQNLYTSLRRIQEDGDGRSAAGGRPRTRADIVREQLPSRKAGTGSGPAPGSAWPPPPEGFRESPPPRMPVPSGGTGPRGGPGGVSGPTGPPGASASGEPVRPPRPVTP